MLGSDAYMWIGSQVNEDDLFQVLTHPGIQVKDNINLHIIHEFFEPTSFTDLFPVWKQRTS